VTNRALLERLLGSSGEDPGCEHCFEIMDEIAETEVAGGDVAQTYPAAAVHLRSCAACREDLDGLRANLGLAEDL
jgi:hypothetical protein